MDTSAALCGAVVLVSTAVAVAQTDWAPAPPKPSPRKPYSTFGAFYRLYLAQHRQPLTKLTHAVGTSAFLACAVAEPRVLLGLGAGLLCGVTLCPLLRRDDTGAREGAVFVGVYLAVGRAAAGAWREVLLAPFCAYLCAWLGHFFVEKNRPATFIYPSYSLLGDFAMLAQLVTRQLPWDGTDEVARRE
jgi:hypothetical protein